MAGGVRCTTLPDGRVLEVRPVRRADLDGLIALYEGLDDDARYKRFFSIYQPPRPFFEKLVTIRERGGLGLVATVTDGPDGSPQIVGEAGFEPLDDGDGELAIAVDQAWRGWLGPYLLDALLEAAAAAGVPNLEADVLCSNLPMLTVLRCRGYALMPRADWTVARMLIGSGGRETPSWPGVHDAPRLLVEGTGGHWRGIDEAQAAGVQVLGCPGPDRDPASCPVLLGEPCPLAAGSDAVLVNHPPATDTWDALRRGHARLHPALPVLVDLLGDAEAREDETDVTGDAPEAVLVEMARQIRLRRGRGRATDAGPRRRPRRGGAVTFAPSQRGRGGAR